MSNWGQKNIIEWFQKLSTQPLFLPSHIIVLTQHQIGQQEFGIEDIIFIGLHDQLDVICIKAMQVVY